MSWKSVPRSSAMPSCRPDLLNGWHGKPPASTAWSLTRCLWGRCESRTSDVRLETPVEGVDRRRPAVDLSSLDRLAPKGTEGGMETADAGEQVNEVEHPYNVEPGTPRRPKARPRATKGHPWWACSAWMGVVAVVREFFKDDRGSTPHPTEVECGWLVVQDGGRVLLQLSTYGSDQRKSEKKVSQTIQLDATAASQLRAIIDQVF